MKTHGMRGTRTYSIWLNMRNRCNRTTHHNYKYYGAVGITVCHNWNSSFINFFNDMGECPEGLTLERLDGAKGYSKENCIWASAERQQNNKSSTIRLTARGKTQSVSDWAREVGVSPHRIKMRIKRGMNHDDAIFAPTDTFVSGISRSQHRPHSALNPESVEYIRNSKLSDVALGEMFNVAPVTISNARSGKTYSDSLTK